MPKLILPGDPPPTQAKGMVHALVADTAKAMAAAVYDGLCTVSNDFYKLWPSEADFVMRRWHNYIQAARIQLVEMLTLPDSMVGAVEKMEIHEALLLHAAVNPAANMLEAPPEKPEEEPKQ